MTHHADDGGADRRSPLSFFIMAGLAVVATLLFTALGIWQVERLAWKTDLIARVDARLAAPAAPAPLPAAWPAITRAEDEYRKVTVTGHFLHDDETLVQAVTERGGGFWVLTPLVTPDANYLINRGFVAPDQRDPASRPEGQVAGDVTVTGLLRITEPGGGFLRANDPARHRWYSRDVAAIAADFGLRTAPFFIDADAAPNPGGAPLGGLTVVTFRNAHLGYLLTWFCLAIGTAGASFYLLRLDWRKRRTWFNH